MCVECLCVYGHVCVNGAPLRACVSVCLNLDLHFLLFSSFLQPFGSGAFQRGQLFKSRDGRFTAPRDGLYQFTAHLHLKLRHKGKRGRARRRLRKRDYVKIQICIDSLCEKNM